MKFKLSSLLARVVGGVWVGGGGVLDFTRLMLISTQVEVVVEVGVELGKIGAMVQNQKLQALLYKKYSRPM